MDAIEHSIAEAKRKLEAMGEDPGNEEEGVNEQKIRQQNGTLRVQLRNMNTNLSDLIDQIKDYNLKKKPVKE